MAGQSTQTQNTHAQNTLGQNTQSPKTSKIEITNCIVVSILGILGHWVFWTLGILGLGILQWNPRKDHFPFLGFVRRAV